MSSIIWDTICGAGTQHKSRARQLSLLTYRIKGKIVCARRGCVMETETKKGEPLTRADLEAQHQRDREVITFTRCGGML